MIGVKIGNPYLELCKPAISLFSTCSALTGYLLFPSPVRMGIAALIAGVFLLACGSCALNQYQEREIDARMERTRKRPLPSGRMRPADALFFSLALIFSGLLLLAQENLVAAGLGLLAMVWYNFIYTPLKKKSPFAVIPGGLTGAIPPVIGWVAAGGEFANAQVLCLSFLFFMWQVPHFWLLASRYGDDYERAGLPSLTLLFSRPQLLRIIFIWICATAVSSLLLLSHGAVRGSILKVSFIAASVLIVAAGARLVRRRGGESACSPLFGRINAYMLIVMLLLALGRFF